MKIIKLKQTIAVAALLGVIGLAHASVTFALAVAGDHRSPVLPAGCEQIEVPAGHRVSSRVYALGVQVYRWNGTAWIFVGPEANLYANAKFRGKVGTHYPGPTWESNSGSLVVGAGAIPCTPDPTAIPWLRLTAVSSQGPGIYDGVTYIQRVNTIGGLRPITPGTAMDEEIGVPYTTEYYFYKAEN